MHDIYIYIYIFVCLFSTKYPSCSFGTQFGGGYGGGRAFQGGGITTSGTTIWETAQYISKVFCRHTLQQTQTQIQPRDVFPTQFRRHDGNCLSAYYIYIYILHMLLHCCFCHCCFCVKSHDVKSWIWGWSTSPETSAPNIYIYI